LEAVVKTLEEAVPEAGERRGVVQRMLDTIEKLGNRVLIL